MRVNNRWTALLLVSVALAGAAGCRSKETPEEALSAFLKSLKNRRASEAFDLLTQSNQEALRTRSEAIAKAADDKEKVTPASLLFEDMNLFVVRTPESISVASPIGKDVVLRVSVQGGDSANVRMVREGERWKVDLLGSLAEFKDYGGKTATATTAAPG